MNLTAGTGAPGTLDVPGVSPYPDDMDIITNAENLPKDIDSLPDDAIITSPVWAHLQGVELATVYRNKTKADKRRGTPDERPGDMPEEDGSVGNSPWWFMRTYRAWSAARPGKGAGAGRPVGTGHGRAVKVRLPLACPHCQHEITREDLGLDESGKPVQAARPATRSGRAAGRTRQLATAGKS